MNMILKNNNNNNKYNLQGGAKKCAFLKMCTSFCTPGTFRHLARKYRSLHELV